MAALSSIVILQYVQQLKQHPTSVDYRRAEKMALTRILDSGRENLLVLQECNQHDVSIVHRKLPFILGIPLFPTEFSASLTICSSPPRPAVPVKLTTRSMDVLCAQNALTSS